MPYDNIEHKLTVLRSELRKRNVEMLYAPEQEYPLRALGILNPLDTVSYPKLLTKGITHILLVNEIAATGAALYSYKTPFELSQQFNPFNPYPGDVIAPASKSEMVFQLVSIKAGTVYSFSTTTQIGGLEIRGNDGGRTAVNSSSVDQARNIALKKGVQRINKYCQ